MEPDIGQIYNEGFDDGVKFAKEALEKQRPMKPLEQRYVSFELKNELIGYCPACKLRWDVTFWQSYCSNCGQKLDWSGVE